MPKEILPRVDTPAPSSDGPTAATVLSAAEVRSEVTWRLFNGWGPDSAGHMRVERIGRDDGSGIRTAFTASDMFGSREDFESLVTCANAYPALIAQRDQLASALSDLWVNARECADWSDDYRERIEALLASVEGQGR